MNRGRMKERIAELENDLVLKTAEAAGLGSQLLDVQRDCVHAQIECDQSTEALAGLAANVRVLETVADAAVRARTHLRRVTLRELGEQGLRTEALLIVADLATALGPAGYLQDPGPSPIAEEAK